MTDHDEIEQKSLKHVKYDVSNIQPSIEGYIIMMTNVHEEATEDDVLDLVTEYGKVVHIHLNTDRRTGYVKGYCLLEYEKLDEAVNAVIGLKKTKFLGQNLDCDFAFTKPNSRHLDRVLDIK
eukprot:NODE_64_length_26047_cov_1.706837.p16 type:complete len:122 gc:universal NODE_64_length_26047_cov_1.706837:21755-22120(+)